jgi:endonuclease/exonuclease/phosphatase family metal-dependent hydrolase
MLPTSRVVRAAALLLPFALFAALTAACVAPVSPGPEGEPSVRRDDGDYLFCFWNLENFFDDKDDGRKTRPDKDYDEWFATDKAVLQQKLDHLSGALMKMNDGQGPDILAAAEVESERAAELLMDAMNAKVKGPEQKYKHILFKEVKAGRHIATVIITRLDVEGNRTQLLGRQMRILEGHLKANGHELVVIASHWTSRVSDAEGEKRDKYADVIYGRFRAMYKSNPKVDFLVCGDFNDPPDDESVTEHLHAIGDKEKVKAGGDEPYLYHLFTDKKYTDGSAGSHFYKGKWMLFDHIAVSPGLLDDEGWTCETETAKVVNDLTADKKGHPHRFGNEHDKGARGWSDHFPVTVRLKVAGK